MSLLYRIVQLRRHIVQSRSFRQVEGDADGHGGADGFAVFNARVPPEHPDQPYRFFPASRPDIVLGLNVGDDPIWFDDEPYGLLTHNIEFDRRLRILYLLVDECPKGHGFILEQQPGEFIDIFEAADLTAFIHRFIRVDDGRVAPVGTSSVIFFDAKGYGVTV